MKTNSVSLFGVLLTSLIAMSANAAMVQINSFEDFIPTGQRYVQSFHNSYDIASETSDQLLIRDPITGQESIISGTYYMGMIVNGEGGSIVAGYGENYHRDFGWDGFMGGLYVGYVTQNNTRFDLIKDGQRPDDIWIVYDGLENGIGYFDTVSGMWILGSDDILYTSEDILFGTNKIRGDVSQLPAFIEFCYGQPAILPAMVIAPVPEPLTIAFLAVGAMLIRKHHS